MSARSDAMLALLAAIDPDAAKEVREGPRKTRVPKELPVQPIPPDPDPLPSYATGRVRKRPVGSLPGRARMKGVAKKYGLTLEQYDALVLSQEGRCRVCEKATEQLVIDHCHTGGHVRGLLCPDCNRTVDLAVDAERVLNAYEMLHQDFSGLVRALELRGVIRKG